MTKSLRLPDPPDQAGSESLLADAARGDAVAQGRLLNRHRERLCRMVTYRLDIHLVAHLDASDIVQDALADAVRKLPAYARDRPLPLYPWLHRLASERLVQARRRYRREQGTIGWPDITTNLLVERFAASAPTPGQVLIQAEQRQRVRQALNELAPTDREVLTLRYLDDLSFPDIAAILDIGEGAAKMRHLRALRRMHTLIAGETSESEP